MDTINIATWIASLNEADRRKVEALGISGGDPYKFLSADAPDTDVVITVGSAGDYTTLNAALEAASRIRPQYIKGGDGAQPMVEVRMLSGFQMAEQVFLESVDMRHVIMTSEASSVTVVRSALTDLFETVHYPAFGFRASFAPIFGCLFSMNTSGTASFRSGIIAENGSTVVFQQGSDKGFRNAGRDNLYIRRMSFIRGWDNDFTGAGRRGLETTENAYGWMRGCNFSNAGGIGCRIDGASVMDLRQITSNNCGDRGFGVSRSHVRMDGVTANNNGSRGIVSQHGSTIVMSGSPSATATGNVGSDLFVQTGGRIMGAETVNYGTSNIQPNVFMNDDNPNNYGFISDADFPQPNYRGTVIANVGPQVNSEFDTISEAIEFLTAYNKMFNAQEGRSVIARIDLDAQFVMNEQVRVFDEDLSWIEIRAFQTTVTINRSAVTTQFEGQRAAFNVRNGALPTFDCSFSMNTSGTAQNQNGVFAVGSRVYFREGRAFSNCTGTNIDIRGGHLVAKGCTFNGAIVGDGIDISRGSTARIDGVTTNNNNRDGVAANGACSVHAANITSTGNGRYGVAIFNGSIVNTSGGTISGSGTRNIHVDRSMVRDNTRLDIYLGGQDAGSLQSALNEKAPLEGANLDDATITNSSIENTPIGQSSPAAVTTDRFKSQGPGINFEHAPYGSTTFVSGADLTLLSISNTGLSQFRGSGATIILNIQASAANQGNGYSTVRAATFLITIAQLRRFTSNPSSNSDASITRISVAGDVGGSNLISSLDVADLAITPTNIDSNTGVRWDVVFNKVSSGQANRNFLSWNALLLSGKLGGISYYSFLD